MNNLDNLHDELMNVIINKLDITSLIMFSWTSMKCNTLSKSYVLSSYHKKQSMIKLFT